MYSLSPVAPPLIVTNIWGRMTFQCGNNNQIADSSINCIFNTRMSRVLKINLTPRSSRLLSVNPLILSHVKSY